MVDRGVSVAVNYTITMIIATLLLGGLLMAAGSVIESQSNNAVQNELTVIGEGLAADIESADRLVTVGLNDNQTTDGFDTEDLVVNITRSQPVRVSGTDYSIDIDGENRSIILEADLTVTIQFDAEHIRDETTSLRGGEVVIGFDGEALEVKNA